MLPVVGASFRVVARLSVAALALAIVACSYAGNGPSNSPSPSNASAAPSVTPFAAVPSASPPTATLRPSRSSETPPSDPYLAQKAQQARQLLASWDALIGAAPADAIVFTGGLEDGGGWNGKNAEDQKSAFNAGLIEAQPDLSAETPPPGSVQWPDGSTQSVDLISASAALAALVADSDGSGSCDGCSPLVVVGAKLVSVKVQTSRGLASVPAWQFLWTDQDTPIDPVTFVAVKDAVVVGDGDLAGATYDGDPLELAYGTAQSTSLTVSFVGSPWPGDNPCGAEYSASSVESDRAVAVIIEEHHSASPFPVQTPPIACPAVGLVRAISVDLSNPLGERTVLDVAYSKPVPLGTGPVPTFSLLPWPMP